LNSAHIRPLHACFAQRFPAAVLLLSALFILLPGDYCSADEAARPNILFIFTDDHAPHAIGAYGGRLQSLNPTPTIDRLAAEGMLFRNSFCTNSVCGPSRAVILTGKHSHLNGFMSNGNRFDGDQQTFPKILQKAGYSTAMIGKWHLNSDPQGFDFWQILPGQGDYYNPVMINAESRVELQGYCTDLVTDLSLEWLKTRDQSRPFVLMCQHKAPHRNWMPPLRHLRLYSDISIPEPPTLFDDWQDNASPARNQEMEIDRHLNLVYDCFGPIPPNWDPNAGNPSDRSGLSNLKRMTPDQLSEWNAGFQAENDAFLRNPPVGKELVRWKYQRYMKNYLRCIRAVDENIARMLDYLKETGLDRNTIVIYASDQGFYLGDHGWYDKRWMYEESLKMPLIVRWPGVTAPGSVSEQLVQNLDYAETFLDIAGQKTPADMQGQSLVPLMKGMNPPDWRKSIYYHYHEFPAVHSVARHYGIRTDRFKLIHFYQSDEWEFYDLKEDPDELQNQYGNSRWSGQIAELKKDLEALRKQYADTTDISPLPAKVQ
jgi:arylsulfatase A-like enzyme